MNDIRVEISNVKNIKKLDISIPVLNEIYCIAGENGVGKSTLITCLAQLISKTSFNKFYNIDMADDAYIKISYGTLKNEWKYNKNLNRIACIEKLIKFNGMYEESLFYGTRFCDSLIIDELVEKNKIKSEDIIDADEYVKEQLSYILHGDKNSYKKLKRIRNKKITEGLGLKNTPYFYEYKNGLVSQYRMSSGECLLISLLHFIYNAIERRSLPTNQPILMVIDEIELALHPIAVTRLLDLLNELTKEHNNLMVILSSHSPELIRKIKPANLYMLELCGESREYNDVCVVNPCYPSYAIRDVYMHSGFDFVFLVEDLLAKYVVEKIIDNDNLRDSCLINVLPVGGWRNVLDFQQRIYTENVFGTSTKIISILDGDAKVMVEQEKKYLSYPKWYLPINSVEKYLLEILVKHKNYNLKKAINDKFFFVESIDSILDQYIKEGMNDKSGKKLYRKILDGIKKRNVEEEEFIKELCDILFKHIDFSGLRHHIKDFIKGRIV